MDIEIIHRHVDNRTTVRSLSTRNVRTYLARDEATISKEPAPVREMREKTTTVVIEPAHVDAWLVDQEYYKLRQEASAEAWRRGWNVGMIIGSEQMLYQRAKRNVQRRLTLTLVQTTYVPVRPVDAPADLDEVLETREVEAAHRDELHRKWARRAKRNLRSVQADNGSRINAQKPRHKRTVHYKASLKAA